MLRGGRHGLSGAAFVRRHCARARTHTHGHAQSHGRRGNTRVKELMGSLGIAEIRGGGGGERKRDRGKRPSLHSRV